MENQITPITKRQTGVTTRIVDHLIQELFAKGKVIVHDIVYVGKTEQEQKQIDLEAMRIFLKRMDSEHPRVKIKVNKSELTVKLEK